MLVFGGVTPKPELESWPLWWDSLKQARTILGESPRGYGCHNLPQFMQAWDTFKITQEVGYCMDITSTS